MAGLWENSMNFETRHIDYKDSAMGRMEQAYKEQTEKQLAESQKAATGV